MRFPHTQHSSKIWVFPWGLQLLLGKIQRIFAGNVKKTRCWNSQFLDKNIIQVHHHCPYKITRQTKVDIPDPQDYWWIPNLELVMFPLNCLSSSESLIFYIYANCISLFYPLIYIFHGFMSHFGAIPVRFVIMFPFLVMLLTPVLAWCL